MSDAVARLNAALEGRYRIDRELDEGGMAMVYLYVGIVHPTRNPEGRSYCCCWSPIHPVYPFGVST